MLSAFFSFVQVFAINGAKVQFTLLTFGAFFQFSLK